MREFGCFNDVSLNISEDVVSQRLNDLRYIKKCHINSVTLQCPHGILNQERIVSVFWQKVGYSCNGIDSSPIEQVLRGLVKSGAFKEAITLSWKETSVGNEAPIRI